jgi:hypothetical protein
MLGQLALEGLSFAIIAPVNLLTRSDLDFEFLPHAFLQKTPDRIDSVALDRQMYLRSTCQGLPPGTVSGWHEPRKKRSSGQCENSYGAPKNAERAASATAKLGLHALPVDAREATVLHCDVMELKYQFV